MCTHSVGMGTYRCSVPRPGTEHSCATWGTLHIRGQRRLLDIYHNKTPAGLVLTRD
jgi:hypothetical protein